MHAFTVTASMLASTLFAVASAAAPGGLVSTYYGQTGTDIETLCEDPSVDIVPIAFVTHFAQKAGEFSTMNFGPNAWADEQWTVDGKVYPGVFNNLHYFLNTIPKCQANGKKVMISFGGDSQSKQPRNFA